MPSVVFRLCPFYEAQKEPSDFLGAADSERGGGLLDLAGYEDPVACKRGGGRGVGRGRERKGTREEGDARGRGR